MCFSIKFHTQLSVCKQSGDVSEIFSSHYDPEISESTQSKNKEPKELDIKATLRDVQSLGVYMLFKYTQCFINTFF